MSPKMPVDLSDLSGKELEEWINNFDVIFCDCDGVLWAHEKLFPFTNETLNKFVSLNKRVYLVTNNSQITREEMTEKCKRMNFNLAIESQVPSSYVTAHYLKQIGFNKKAFVCGPPALSKFLTDSGIENFGVGADHLDCSIVEYCLQKLELEEDVGAVVVGFDAEFSYIKLLKAVNYLQDPEVKFIATNSDAAFKFPWFTLPETGGFVAAIEKTTGRKATVIGKPSAHAFKVVEGETTPINPERALMIGDSLEADIPFGKNCGIKTLLVLSGTHKLKDVQEVINKFEENPDEELLKMIPDFSIPHLGDFAKKFANKM